MNNEVRLHFFRQILPLQALRTPFTVSADKESDSGWFLHPFSPFLPGPVALLLMWQKKTFCSQQTQAEDKLKWTESNYSYYPYLHSDPVPCVAHLCQDASSMGAGLGIPVCLAQDHASAFPYTAQLPQVFQGSLFFSKVQKQSKLPVQKATPASDLPRIRRLTSQLV